MLTGEAMSLTKLLKGLLHPKIEIPPILRLDTLSTEAPVAFFQPT